MTMVLAAPMSGGLAVDAPDAECAWLQRFLSPAFGVMSGRNDRTAHVRLVESPPPSPSGAVDDRVAFVLDRRPVRLATSTVVDTVVAADPELQVTYAVRGGKEAAVHRGGRDDLTRIGLMRVVREYAHNALVDSGGLVIHAAAWAGPRGAVLVTGPKGVGKTTLLARMLALGGVSYLANDRVGVTPDLRAALAIPTIVAVRPGTRCLLPEFAERLRPLGRFTELDDTSATPPDRTSYSWYFAPRQFAHALSCGLTASAHLAAIVMLRPGEAPGPLRDAAPSEAADLLVESLLGAHAGVFISEVFRADAPATDVGERLHADCRRLANAVPCLALPAPVSLDDATLDRLSSLCG